MKQIRPKDNENEAEWSQLYREVETLQKARHRNIVPLLSSYYINTIDSSDRSQKVLYLLLPWADMDLETWMNCSEVPPSIGAHSRGERRAYIYRCMYGLVSGLSYLHREIGGWVTSHHDLKPSNILVIGEDFKIADLGRSHLRPVDSGSATAGADGLGTYDYQPPEYYQDDGSRSRTKHGRAFDIWAMGCILVELATLVVHDWSLQMVAKFRRMRADNGTPDRPKLVGRSRNKEDSSFHNNRSVIKSWIVALKQKSGASNTLEETLEIIEGMLAYDPRRRLLSWETEIDLYKIQNPFDLQVGSIGQGPLCLKPPPEGDSDERVFNGAQTPLHRAVLKEDTNRTRDLLHLGWPIFVQDYKGDTALDMVKRSPDRNLREAVRQYFGQGTIATAENQGVDLLEAVKTHDITKIQALLEKGVSPLLVTSEGQSALSLATLEGQISIIAILLQSEVKEQLLLKDQLSGATVLHRITKLGRDDILRQLLFYSPMLEDRQHDGKTALFLAIESNNESVVQVLLEHHPHAQVYTQSNTGDTPVHKAASRDHKLLELLLNTEGSENCLEHRNQLGETPVWLALRSKNFQNFRLLKERGACLSIMNNDNENLLHIVAQEGLEEFLYQNLQDLNAADIEVPNRWNDTPLSIADRLGYPDIARLLRSHYFGRIKRNQMKALESNTASTKPPMLFYTLNSDPKWLRRGSGGYWTCLTLESYNVYQSIYQYASMGQERVYCEPNLPPPHTHKLSPTPRTPRPHANNNQ